MKVPAAAVCGLLAVVTAALAGNSGKSETAVLLKSYAFRFDEDLDLDRQPDGWQRIVDRDHPHYVPAGLDFSTFLSGKGSLRMQGDGASVEYLSPPVEIEGPAAYDVSGYIKAENITDTGPRAASARIEVRFYDKSGVMVGSRRCFPEVTGTTDWQQVWISDATARTPGAVTLRAAAILDGLTLSGNVWFDSVEIRKRPVATLRTNRTGNCFYASDRKTLIFEAGGLPAAKYSVTFRVKDDKGASVHEVTLDASASPDGVLSVSYNLPQITLGAHTVDLALMTDGTPILMQSVRMGVLPDKVTTETARNFGIAVSVLPAPDAREYDLAHFADVGWLKLPFQTMTAAEKSQYLVMISQLRRNGITPVGVVVVPDGRGGADAQAASGQTGKAEEFRDTINTFAGNVLYWEMAQSAGNASTPGDISTQSINETADFIGAVSYNSKLGLGFSDWLARRSSPDLRIAFVCATLDRLAEAYAWAGGGPETWAYIEPAKWLGAANPLSLAAADISAAFGTGASIAFLKDPWQTRGVLDGDGSVTPFALGLMNIIDELSNCRYAGSIALPRGTANAVFRSPEETKVLLWPSAGPVEERVFLGDNVYAVNSYGLRQPVEVKEGDNVIQLVDTPIILKGVDPAIVEMRKTFVVAPSVVDSLYDTQPIYVTFTNKFNSPIVGELALALPQGWEAQQNVFFVRLKPGESFRGRSNVVVPYNALAGPQDVRATLMLGDAGGQRITLLQRIELASYEFKMEITMRPAAGGIQVYQKVTNLSKRAADLSAFLSGEGMERVERLPRRLEAGTTTTFSYTLADGELWAGKKLRASIRETRTNRFLNEEFIVAGQGMK